MTSVAGAVLLFILRVVGTAWLVACIRWDIQRDAWHTGTLAARIRDRAWAVWAGAVIADMWIAGAGIPDFIRFNAFLIFAVAAIVEWRNRWRRERAENPFAPSTYQRVLRRLDDWARERGTG